MEPGGVGLERQRPHPRRCNATPVATSRADRSGCSAPRTTRPGWPPRRACPTSSPTTSPGAAPPRRSSSTARRFRPSPELAEPRTFLTVNAVVRRDRTRRRERLALPQPAGDGGAAHRRPAARRSAWSRRPRRSSLPDAHRALVDAMRSPLGRSATPTSAARAARRAGRDVRRRRGDGAPGRGRPRGHRPTLSPAREETLRLLAAGRFGFRPPFALDWRVGPTWVCFVVPRGCPDARLDLAQRGLGVRPGMRSHETAARGPPGSATCSAGGSRADR